MTGKICCFTGHRTIPEPQRTALAVALDVEVRRLIREGYRYFGAGGALGFDTMAAQSVLKLRQEFPHIRLILVLPCADQATRWQESDRLIYERIKEQADKVVCLANAYTPDCMLRRNRHLVDHSDACVCYQTQPSGGTAYTVGYAKSRGVPVINLAEKL